MFNGGHRIKDVPRMVNMFLTQHRDFADVLGLRILRGGQCNRKGPYKKKAEESESE